jgi:predicted  nucleic acid-binding Zn-ribbon protein
VTGAWAVAATAIAVIALISANRDDSAEIDARTASQIERVQRQLTERLDDIESRLDDLAPASDVTRLDNRLKKVENAATKEGTRVAQTRDDVDDLQTRVDELEQAAESGAGTTGTDTDETDATP